MPPATHGELRLRPVDQDLHHRPRVGLQAALEIPRDHHRHAGAALAHEPLELVRGVRGVAHVHHLRGLELRDELARHRGVRVVLHHGGEIAHVEVDGIAEQHDLHERHADDHAEGDAVARQLAHFLGGHGPQAPQRCA